MPHSHGLITSCALLMVIGCLLFAAGEEIPRASSSATDVEQIAHATRQFADEAKFSEVELRLQTLAQTQTTADVRFATALYAAQQAYSAGRRDLAEQWLRSLEADAPPKLKLAIADGLAWVRLNPRDLQDPTPLLLEQATKHGHSSLAAVALLQRADLLAEEKRNDEALWVYHALARQFSATRFAAPAILKAAKLHAQLGQQQETITWTERLLQDHAAAPEVAGALYLLAGAAATRGDSMKATAALEKIIAEHATTPYWPDASYRLAEQHFKAGRTEPALEIITGVLANKSTSPVLQGRCFFLQAQAAIAKKAWPAAEETLAQLLAGKPEESLRQLAAFWQAEVAFQRGNVKQAEERFNAITSTGSEEWLAIVPLRQAQLAARRQDWPLALKRLEELAQRHPQHARQQEAEYLRARSLLALARFRESREVLQKIVAEKKTSSTETCAMAQWMIGESYFLQQQYEAALAAYDQTLTFDKFPNWQAAALLQSAKCCEQLKRREEAVQRYQRIVREFSHTQYAAEAKRRLGEERLPATIAEQPTINNPNRK